MRSPSIEMIRLRSAEEIAVELMRGLAERAAFNGYNLLVGSDSRFEGQVDRD
jgi:hypothetical protein